MSRAKLYEVKLPTDRWSVSAFSPTDIRDGIEPGKHGHPVIVHPGWGKTPKNYLQLLDKLTSAGFLAIGVDTRYGYADRQLPGSHKPRVLTQKYITSKTNPYFESAGRQGNRWQYRRPTALLHLLEQLGIGERSYVGHSEGARIVALAGLAKVSQTKRVVLVNGVGTGSSEDGIRHLTHANLNMIHRLASGGVDNPLDIVLNAVRSTAYTTTHLKRTINEKRVIESANIWPVVDELTTLGVPVDIFHAKEDELVSFEDSSREASLRPNVNFIPTEGNHSNIYEEGVVDQIVGLIAA